MASIHAQAFCIPRGGGAGARGRDAGRIHLSGASAPQLDTSAPLLVMGGLLVGLGTRLASGCTSGHGICGIARLSSRSLVAVAAFMITAMVTVFLRFQG